MTQIVTRNFFTKASLSTFLPGAALVKLQNFDVAEVGKSTYFSKENIS